MDKNESITPGLIAERACLHGLKLMNEPLLGPFSDKDMEAKLLTRNPQWLLLPPVRTRSWEGGQQRDDRGDEKSPEKAHGASNNWGDLP